MRRFFACIALLAVLGAIGPAVEIRGDGACDLVIEEPEDGDVVKPPFRVSGRVFGTPPPPQFEEFAAPCVLVNWSPCNLRSGGFSRRLHPEDGRFEIDARWVENGFSSGTVYAQSTITVIVDSTPPILEILVPASPEQVVHPERAKIVGRVFDPNLEALTIFGNRVEVEPGGCFALRIAVSEGKPAQVSIVAWDVVGNRTQMGRTFVGRNAAPTWRRVEASREPSRAKAPAFPGGRAAALSTARSVEAGLIRAAAAARRHAVSLATVDRDGTGTAGSGVVVDLDGRPWILTADHVVDDAERVAASGPDAQYQPARVHDGLPRFDVALLALADGAALPAVPLRDGERREPATVGAWVLVTGNPRNLCHDGEPAVLRGLVSSTRREIRSAAGLSLAVQHDARTQPGCSGGGLWDLDGHLLGISVRSHRVPDFKGAAETSVGVTYATPMSQIRPFLADLEGGASARAATLGLETATELDDRGQALGARIVSIDPRGPLGGLDERRAPRPGDVILELVVEQEGHRVRTGQDLDRLLAPLRPGAAVTIRYRRGGARLSWTTRVQEEPK